MKVRLIKSMILVIVLVFCSLRAYADSSQGKFGIEMAGGYSFATLSNFNKNFVNVYNYGFLNGFVSPVSATVIPGILQADIKLRYNVANGIPVYLRLGLTRLVDTDILYNSATHIDVSTSVVSFNMAYAGVGAKYGFEFLPAFTLFVGADGGIYIPVDSYWKVTGNTTASPIVNSNTADPLYNASQRIDFTKTYFGGNVELGVEWATTDSWGLIIEGGYKIAKNPVTYNKTGIFTRTSFDFTELDFSGPYLTAGIVLYFGDNKYSRRNV